MSSWRDAILNDFVPKVSKLTLVADPDRLLTEEKLALELRRRGFELIEFHDPVEFRYAYESRYRSLWDRGAATELVVILRVQDTELDFLPYDLLQAGRKLSFNLGEIFPHLSYPVIENLDRSLLDAVFEAQRAAAPDRLGDNASKDFILRHVFGIAAELISTEVDLLRALLRLHYGNRPIPPMLAERLIQVLKGHDTFKTWPLAEIIPDAVTFFAFLQERWPIYLSQLAQNRQLREDVREYGLRHPGPAHLPFDHQDIRVYIDNLFLEGKLTPVEAPESVAHDASWIRSGIVGQDKDELRIVRLFDRVEKELPTAQARYSDWITFAWKWAELSALVHCGHNSEHKARRTSLGDTLNEKFAAWLTEHYDDLRTLSPNNPAMLHHVARRLAQDLEASASNRAALIVVDGLAMDQWITIRHELQKEDANLVLRESAVFAWIPTLTSVSRQAIFSGKAPFYFPGSINTTSSEEKLWKQFWEDQNLSSFHIAYQRGLGDTVDVLESTISSGKTKMVGLVVDKVDKIMHGMQLGAAGMHTLIKQWCQGNFLSALVGQLLEYGYAVWLTADHGNIQCQGTGRPKEGALAETRGERVRVYPTAELRAREAEAFPQARAWTSKGLPTEYFPLLAGGHDAFVNPGDALVSHGGAAIEEVIVPLVKFERRTR
ncbi:MAG: BREX-3 system phosphatase PglZ [Desulfovibrio sp.]|nr:BREX-3 system phosphatase PglZ [Desulfovibrio sp.]